LVARDRKNPERREKIASVIATSAPASPAAARAARRRARQRECQARPLEFDRRLPTPRAMAPETPPATAANAASEPRNASAASGSACPIHAANMPAPKP
jgi:hypothetical protein